MPRIFLKPRSAEYADPKKEATKTRLCDMPGCLAGDANHRAPKSRDLSAYYWFCFEHAKEYNSAWNYFSGMSDHEVEDHIVRSHYGDRPTWRYDIDGVAEENLRRKAWQTYRSPNEEQSPRERAKRNIPKTPESEALAIMDLEPPIALEDIKARYKVLVKKYHPDVNRDDPKAEELLKSINMAYTILKLAYEKFSELPDEE